MKKDYLCTLLNGRDKKAPEYDFSYIIYEGQIFYIRCFKWSRYKVPVDDGNI